jgi:hypothetical protein
VAARRNRPGEAAAAGRFLNLFGQALPVYSASASPSRSFLRFDARRCCIDLFINPILALMTGTFY